MNLTKLTADLAVIAKLPDSPTETAAELKAKFDQGSRAIGDYLNDTLLPEVEEALALIDDKAQTIEQTKQNKILSGTTAPTGGRDGDLYIWY